MPRAYEPNRHAQIMTNASRCVDIARIAGIGVLSSDLLEQGYQDCWYAYQHAVTVKRRLSTGRHWRAADVWLEKSINFQKTGRLIWREMVRRGLRKETGIGETGKLGA